MLPLDLLPPLARPKWRIKAIICRAAVTHVCKFRLVQLTGGMDMLEFSVSLEQNYIQQWANSANDRGQSFPLSLAGFQSLLLSSGQPSPCLARPVVNDRIALPAACPL